MSLRRASFRWVRRVARSSYVLFGNAALGAFLAGRSVLVRARRQLARGAAPSFGATGVHATTRGWAARRHGDGDAYIELDPAMRLERREPRGVHPSSSWDPDEFVRDAPPTFVARVPHGRVHGEFGNVVTDDGRVLRDVSLLHPRYAFRSSAVRNVPVAPPEQVGQRLCVLSVEWGHNYYHWLFDALPRLALLRRAEIDLDAIDAFVVNKTPLPFQNEVWTALGLPAHKIIETDHTLHLTSECVVVTSSLQESAHARPWVCDFLRSSLAPRTNPEGPKRIFISRGDTGSRRLLNEPACVDLLRKHGFVTLSLSGMHIADQAASFAAADVVIGAHGAGLANLVFCRPGTIVVELHSPTWPATNFWELSDCVGLDYRYLMGRSVQPPGLLGRGLALRKSVDYRVDIEALSRILDELETGVSRRHGEVAA